MAFFDAERLVGKCHVRWTRGDIDDADVFFRKTGFLHGLGQSDLRGYFRGVPERQKMVRQVRKPHADETHDGRTVRTQIRPVLLMGRDEIPGTVRQDLSPERHFKNVVESQIQNGVQKNVRVIQILELCKERHRRQCHIVLVGTEYF